MSEPEPSLVRDLIAAVHDEFAGDRSGESLQGVPALEGIDEDAFGICVAMADGQTYEVGDTDVAFCIQSISKAFTYGLALSDHGKGPVDDTIDMEPSGDAFNEISLHPVTGRPRNPMINAGAIAAASLVRGGNPTQQSQRIKALYETYAGRELAYEEAVLADELRDGHRNRAISHMLMEAGKLRTSPEHAIDVYLRQCSVLVTCRDLAMMGATLANNGRNPLTGETAISTEHAERVLSVMSTCGMYDAAGEWVAEVGMAAKSGVGGGIVAVLPGQLAIAVFSPRLDAHGNSVRGVAACRRLSEELELHALHVTRSSRNAIRVAYDLDDAQSPLQRPEADRRVLEEHGHAARIYELHGDLLFAGAESVVRRLCQDGRDLEFVALDVRAIDDVAAIAGRMLGDVRRLLRGWGCEPVVITYPDAKTVATEGEAPTPVFHSQHEAILWIEEQLLDRHGEGVTPEGDFTFTDHPVLEHLDPDLLKTWRSRMDEVRFGDGETIVEQGDEEAGVFLLMSGRVRQSLRRGDTERSIATLTPGTCFGDVYLVTDKPHPMTVTAEGPVRLLTLTRETYADIRDSDPVLHALMLEAFMHAIHGEQARMLGAIAGNRHAEVVTV